MDALFPDYKIWEQYTTDAFGSAQRLVPSFVPLPWPDCEPCVAVIGLLEEQPSHYRAYQARRRSRAGLRCHLVLQGIHRREHGGGHHWLNCLLPSIVLFALSSFLQARSTSVTASRFTCAVMRTRTPRQWTCGTPGPRSPRRTSLVCLPNSLSSSVMTSDAGDAALMNTWTTVTGYPYLKVVSEKWTEKEVVFTLEQSRFLADGSADEESTVWSIPLLFAAPGLVSEEAAIMDRKVQSFAVPLDAAVSLDKQWIKINAGQKALVCFHFLVCNHFLVQYISFRRLGCLTALSRSSDWLLLWLRRVCPSWAQWTARPSSWTVMPSQKLVWRRWTLW